MGSNYVLLSRQQAQWMLTYSRIELLGTRMSTTALVYMLPQSTGTHSIQGTSLNAAVHVLITPQDISI
jgi:hypothetical protein